MREVVQSVSKQKSREKKQASINIMGNQTTLRCVAEPVQAVVQRKPMYDKAYPNLQGPIPPVLGFLGGALMSGFIGLMMGESPAAIAMMALLGGALGMLATIALARKKKPRKVKMDGMSQNLEKIRDGSKVPAVNTGRVGTSVSSATGTNREGQHTISHIGLSTFTSALTAAGNSPRELRGSRLMPDPGTEERIADQQKQDAVSRGVVTQAEADKRERRMMQSYEREYMRLTKAATPREEADAALSVMSHEATASHGQYDPLTHAQLKGKGERRTTAAREMLGQGAGGMLDTLGMPPLTTQKAQKKMRLIERLAQSRGGSVELSEDTEAEDR